MLISLVAAVAYTARSSARTAALGRRGLHRTPPVFMPEGPECAVHAESLHSRFSGATLSRVAILSGRYCGDGSIPGRGAAPEHWGALGASLPATVERVDAKGKFIYWHLAPLSGAHAGELTFWSTLGMSGAWSVERTAHSRVCFELLPQGPKPSDDEARRLLFYNDMRGFGTLTVSLSLDKLEQKLASLGPAWLGTSEERRASGGECARSNKPQPARL